MKPHVKCDHTLLDQELILTHNLHSRRRMWVAKLQEEDNDSRRHFHLPERENEREREKHKTSMYQAKLGLLDEATPIRPEMPGVPMHPTLNRSISQQTLQATSCTGPCC